jgi:hypothetical protein
MIWTPGWLRLLERIPCITFAYICWHLDEPLMVTQRHNVSSTEMLLPLPPLARRFRYRCLAVTNR